MKYSDRLVRPARNFYAVYDREDNAVMVGTAEEVARWLGVNVGTIYSKVFYTQHHERPDGHIKYRVYRIEEGE